jgi:hypothetical protein
MASRKLQVPVLVTHTIQKDMFLRWALNGFRSNKWDSKKGICWEAEYRAVISARQSDIAIHNVGARRFPMCAVRSCDPMPPHPRLAKLVGGEDLKALRPGTCLARNCSSYLSSDFYRGAVFAILDHIRAKKCQEAQS